MQLLGLLKQGNTERRASARSFSAAMMAACSQKATQQLIAATESNKKSLELTPKLSMTTVKGVKE